MSIRSRVLPVLPLALYSKAVGWMAARRWPRPVVSAAIRAFARKFGVDTSEAAQDIGEFETFQDFFSRQLRPNARPIDRAATLVSPADGLVVSADRVHAGSTVQAKGISYDVGTFIGEPAKLENGHQVTIYLSPRDYHRVHVPCAGAIVGVRRFAGRRLPVGVAYAASIPHLFEENERAVFSIKTTAGVVAVVMVGATGVSAIRASVSVGDRVEPGDELGVFLLGSTVVTIWDAAVGDASSVAAGDVVRVGQRIV
ncbi:MAG: phosphatidylserine decarboxylase [Deltaproteobacteria bacterium]|nr:phosphatidylserine decarboxylase [Deltaproteobacteria bacterium]